MFVALVFEDERLAVAGDVRGMAGHVFGEFADEARRAVGQVDLPEFAGPTAGDKPRLAVGGADAEIAAEFLLEFLDVAGFGIDGEERALAASGAGAAHKDSAVGQVFAVAEVSDVAAVADLRDFAAGVFVDPGVRLDRGHR